MLGARLLDEEFFIRGRWEALDGDVRRLAIVFVALRWDLILISYVATNANSIALQSRLEIRFGTPL
jgi:hypothetical protein